MCTVCFLEALQYREKSIQISKKARSSIDAFGPSSLLANFGSSSVKNHDRYKKGSLPFVLKPFYNFFNAFNK